MKFVNESKLVIDPMHAKNGTLRIVLHALNKLKLFDLKAFKASNKDKPLSSLHDQNGDVGL